VFAAGPFLALQIDRAVQILLETSPDEKSYYENSLKACLLATLKEDTSTSAQSTLKLIATSLIACGKYRGEGMQHIVRSVCGYGCTAL